MTVEFRNVSFTYWQTDKPALKDISLLIPKGQFVVLTGPTGAGKSTFLQTLNGLIPHHVPGRLEGEVLINGKGTKGTSVAELSREVGLVFEDPDSQIVSLTVEDDVAFGPSNLGLKAGEISACISRALTQTRLKGFEGRNPFTLSGGEKQSLAMAGILAMQPNILALDEPTAMLDPIGRTRIISILKALATDTNATILLVEQNLELVIELADRVLLFDEGRVIKDGRPQEVFDDIETLLRVGVKIPPVVEVFWELRKRNFWKDAPLFSVDEAAAVLKPKIPNHGPVGTAIETTEIHDLLTNEPIVNVQRVEHNFGDEVEALKSVNVKFHPGKMTAIVGQNGSGKSTLAYHLVGILQPTNPEGRVFVDRLNVRKTPIPELIRHVNYIFQNPDDQLFQESVVEEIEYGLKKMGIPEEERKRRINQVIALFGLRDYADQPPKSLRRGLRTKTAIASIIAMQPTVLVVDEPTTGLDRSESLEIMRILEKETVSGMTVVFITHEMDLVAQFAQRVVVMHAGNILGDGTPAQVFVDTNVLQQASLSPPDIYRLAMSLGLSNFSTLCTPADLIDQITMLMEPR